MKILVLMVVLFSFSFGDQTDFYAENRKIEIEELVASINGKPELEAIQKVNQTLNAYPYAKDTVKSDEWIGLDALISRGKGDCEDVAIAKAEVIKKAMPSVDTYVLAGKGHARLLVVCTEGVYILDNQNWKLIPASEVNMDGLKTIAMDDKKIVTAMNVKQ